MILQYDELNELPNGKIADELTEIREQLQSIYSMMRGVVDFKTAAKILNISTGHLYQLTSKKEIPFYKPKGKLIYFDVHELTEWVKKTNLERISRNVSEQEVDQAMLRKIGK